MHSYYSISIVSLSLTPHAHTCTHAHTHTHAPTHTHARHMLHMHSHTHPPTHTYTPHVTHTHTHTHTHTTATPFRLASLELVESNTYSLRKKLITHLVKCHLLWWPLISLFVHYRATKTRNYSRVWLPRQASAKGEDYPKQFSPSSKLCWPRYIALGRGGQPQVLL